MKNAKLNLFHLENEDVITTSLSCSHVYGVGEIYTGNDEFMGEYRTYWYCKNGETDYDGDEYEGSLPDGVYHVDKDGNFIEICPVWNGASSYEDYNYDEINKAHGGTGLSGD